MTLHPRLKRRTGLQAETTRRFLQLKTLRRARRLQSVQRRTYRRARHTLFGQKIAFQLLKRQRLIRREQNCLQNQFQIHRSPHRDFRYKVVTARKRSPMRGDVQAVRKGVFGVGIFNQLMLKFPAIW